MIGADVTIRDCHGRMPISGDNLSLFVEQSWKEPRRKRCQGQYHVVQMHASVRKLLIQYGAILIVKAGDMYTPAALSWPHPKTWMPFSWRCVTTCTQGLFEPTHRFKIHIQRAKRKRKRYLSSAQKFHTQLGLANFPWKRSSVFRNDKNFNLEPWIRRHTRHFVVIYHTDREGMWFEWNNFGCLHLVGGMPVLNSCWGRLQWG